MSTAPSLSKPIRITVWVLQIIVGLMFVSAGVMKLAGAQFAVEIFEHVGIGQWFRYLTGAVELVAGLLLLLPLTAPSPESFWRSRWSARSSRIWR